MNTYIFRGTSVSTWRHNAQINKFVLWSAQNPDWLTKLRFLLLSFGTVSVGIVRDRCSLCLSTTYRLDKIELTRCLEKFYSHLLNTG